MPLMWAAAAEHGEGLLPRDVEGDGQVRRGLLEVLVADLGPHVRADPAPQVRRLIIGKGCHTFGVVVLVLVLVLALVWWCWCYC